MDNIKPATPTRDYLTEILWLLTTARNLASDCGRDALAQDLQDQIQALDGTDEEF